MPKLGLLKANLPCVCLSWRMWTGSLDQSPWVEGKKYNDHWTNKFLGLGTGKESGAETLKPASSGRALAGSLKMPSCQGCQGTHSQAESMSFRVSSQWLCAAHFEVGRNHDSHFLFGASSSFRSGQGVLFHSFHSISFQLDTFKLPN